MWMCLYNIQMPRPPVVHLPLGNGPQGRLSIAIRPEFIAPANARQFGRWASKVGQIPSNASGNVFLLVTGWIGALKCGAGNSDFETIACREFAFTSPCDLSNTA